MIVSVAVAEGTMSETTIVESSSFGNAVVGAQLIVKPKKQTSEAINSNLSLTLNSLLKVV